VCRRGEQQGIALERIEHLDQAVRAVAQAETDCAGKLSVEAGRKQRQRQVGEAALIDQVLRLLQAAAGTPAGRTRNTCSLVTRP
jgi:hypothetical protein